MIIRVSAISYLNTIPFVYGLKNHKVSKMIGLQYSSPGAAAADLLEGRSDLGIVPSVIVPKLGIDKIVSDFCISAVNNVASVLICSNVPLEQIDLLHLDSDSRTSVMLTKILCRRYWKIAPRYISYDSSKGDPESNASYLLIGDKALKFSARYNYVYDLAIEWYNFTNTPFVFACWASNKDLDPGFLTQFNQALSYGVNNIEAAVDSIPHQFERNFAVKYLKNNISFKLTPEKREGLSLFWNLSKLEY